MPPKTATIISPPKVANANTRRRNGSLGSIRSISSQREDRGILIEVDSDSLAKWLTNKINRALFCMRLGKGVTFRSKTYNVIAFNTPLNIDPENQAHREEVNEANQLEENTISAIQWAKPTTRRAPQQQTAHMIVSFIDPEAANRVISNGITICNKKCHAARLKRNHFAA